MCGKGTVLDVLSNHKIHLDDMFKSSMINDTAKVRFKNTRSGENPFYVFPHELKILIPIT